MARADLPALHIRPVRDRPLPSEQDVAATLPVAALLGTNIILLAERTHRVRDRLDQRRGVGIEVERDGADHLTVLWYWMWCVPGAVLSTPMLAITKIILAVAGAALRLANPCGISGVAKVAQQDRRSAPPDGRDRI
jgi:hypothetical protein